MADNADNETLGSSEDSVMEALQHKLSVHLQGLTETGRCVDDIFLSSVLVGYTRQVAIVGFNTFNKTGVDEADITSVTLMDPANAVALAQHIIDLAFTTMSETLDNAITGYSELSNIVQEELDRRDATMLTDMSTGSVQQG